MSEEETIFHKIIKREVPADIVYEDEKVISFRDINPASATHLLVVPKKTLPTMRDVGAEDKELLGHMMFVATELAVEEGIAEDGYRLVINTGSHGGQTVFQIHLHLLGGRSFSWPPG